MAVDSACARTPPAAAVTGPCAPAIQSRPALTWWEAETHGTPLGKLGNARTHGGSDEGLPRDPGDNGCREAAQGGGRSQPQPSGWFPRGHAPACRTQHRLAVGDISAHATAPPQATSGRGLPPPRASASPSGEGSSQTHLPPAVVGGGVQS